MSGRAKAAAAVSGGVLFSLTVVLVAVVVSRQPDAPKGGGRPRPRAAFSAGVSGMTPGEVRQAIGDPDSVTEPPVGYVGPNQPAPGVVLGWQYRRVSYEADPSKPDRDAMVWFLDGRVTHVTFYSQEGKPSLR